MNYKEEAIKIELKLIELLKEEKFEEFDSHLEKRVAFYKEYSEYSFEEAKEFFNSKEFKNYQDNLKQIYSKKNSEIKAELNRIANLKRANQGYQNSVVANNMFLNKKI